MEGGLSEGCGWWRGVSVRGVWLVEEGGVCQRGVVGGIQSVQLNACASIGGWSLKQGLNLFQFIFFSVFRFG